MEEIIALLGPFPQIVPLNSKVIERVDCGNYIREKVEYDVEVDDRVSAYVCVPKNLTKKAPAIFCHHQHNREFDIGKSEVVGLMGNKDQAYASELAELGYVTFAPDAIAFEERNWASPGSSEYHELASRLVKGETLMAKAIHDVMRGIDYLHSRDEVDAAKTGFIGHSYGGRMALWMPAFDARIKTSVSNCGCVSYADSFPRDIGFQMEFCIPGIAIDHDVASVVKNIKNCSLLISATDNDVWSLGASKLYELVKSNLGDMVELKLYEGGHEFRSEMRLYAYDFFSRAL